MQPFQIKVYLVVTKVSSLNVSYIYYKVTYVALNLTSSLPSYTSHKKEKRENSNIISLLNTDAKILKNYHQTKLNNKLKE